MGCAARRGRLFEDVFTVFVVGPFVVVGFGLEALYEVFVPAQSLRCPTCLGHSCQARQHEVLQRIGLNDIFGPEVSLNTFVVGQERSVNAFGRLVIIDRFDGFGAVTLRTRFRGVLALSPVDIIGDLR